MTSHTAADDMGDAVVRLDAVGVRYRLVLEAPGGLKEAIVGGRRRRVAEHAALRAVSLEVRRGETFGVIGGNGAGKTTLLRLIARVLHPSDGRIRIRGRVAPLIDLFGMLHHELNGRENAYLAGALLGLGRREMRAKIDGIEAFAGIGAFFDAPLRAYSAGMMVRLAFATATSIDADILLIDEALAVGDAAFQRSSRERIEAFRRAGVTSVIASHDVRHLADICDRMLWLDRGRVAAIGASHHVAEQYLAMAGAAE